MRVFILNGPPSIGKDTLANNISNQLGFPHLAFKTALYRETANYFGVSLAYMLHQATDRDFKEVPNKTFDGFSPRGALIHVSESIIKPLHGKKFFGIKAAEEIHALDGVAGSVVFSDGGFAEECECLVERGFEVHIIQLQRKGFTFKGDSRNYVSVPGATVHRINTVQDHPMIDLGNFLNILEKLDNA